MNVISEIEHDIKDFDLCIIVPYDNEYSKLEFVNEHLSDLTKKGVELVLLGDSKSKAVLSEFIKTCSMIPCQVNFFTDFSRNSSKAINFAVASTSKSNILIWSASVRLIRGGIGKLACLLKNYGPGFTVPNILYDESKNTKINLSREFSFARCIMMEKTAFTSVRGYNELLGEYGLSDVNFMRKLEYKRFQCIVVNDVVLDYNKDGVERRMKLVSSVLPINLLKRAFFPSSRDLTEDKRVNHKDLKRYGNGTPKRGFFNRYKLSKNDEALGILDSLQSRNIDQLNIVNIALFGVDQRTENDEANSDVIMVVSLNTESREIKLLSIMRDTYLEIDGVGFEKLNAAYAKGGPFLAIKTLNQNFHLNIRNFISVDFFGMEKIIDALGGLLVNVKQEELLTMNYYIEEVADLKRRIPRLILRAGEQQLNGEQSVVYTRIRLPQSSDWERTQRQRVVLATLLSKIRKTGVFKLPVMGWKVLPAVMTNMTIRYLAGLSFKFVGSEMTINKKERFPLDSESNGEVINGTWYLKADLIATAKSMGQFILTK